MRRSHAWPCPLPPSPQNSTPQHCRFLALPEEENNFAFTFAVSCLCHSRGASGTRYHLRASKASGSQRRLAVQSQGDGFPCLLAAFHGFPWIFFSVFSWCLLFLSCFLHGFGRIFDLIGRPGPPRCSSRPAGAPCRPQSADGAPWPRSRAPP